MRWPRLRYTVRRMMVAVAAVGIALGLLEVARRPFAPADWVEVTVLNVPRGLRQIYLIADGPEGPHALNWYFCKVLVWTEDPREERTPAFLVGWAPPTEAGWRWA
jgi:hypothetical protein